MRSLAVILAALLMMAGFIGMAWMIFRIPGETVS